MATNTKRNISLTSYNIFVDNLCASISNFDQFTFGFLCYV